MDAHSIDIDTVFWGIVDVIRADPAGADPKAFLPEASDELAYWSPEVRDTLRARRRAGTEADVI